MQECADARAAKFLRPNLWQMIERKQNSHAQVLAQAIPGCDAVVAAAVSRPELAKQIAGRGGCAQHLRSYRHNSNCD